MAKDRVTIKKDFYQIMIVLAVGLVGVISVIITLSHPHIIFNENIGSAGGVFGTYASGGAGDGSGGGGPIGAALTEYGRHDIDGGQAVDFSLNVTGGSGSYTNVILNCEGYNTTMTFAKAYTGTCNLMFRDLPYSISASGSDGGSGFTSNVLSIAPTAVCTDSDGGNMPYVLGTTTGMYGGNLYRILSDFCDNSTVLREFYCLTPNDMWRDIITCQYGCLNGVCLPQPAMYSLNINRLGAGSGAVISSPAGIDCGANCQAFFNAGASVTLTANAGVGSIFAGWSSTDPGFNCGSSNTCTIIMGQARTVSATFSLSTVLNSLNVLKSGNGSGMVTSVPSGINCDPTCSAFFDSSISVILTATPSQASIFSGWSGGVCAPRGSINTCTVPMSTSRTETAIFSMNQSGPVIINATLHNISSIFRTDGEDVSFVLSFVGGSPPFSAVLHCGDGYVVTMSIEGVGSSDLSGICSYTVGGPTTFKANATGADSKGIAFKSNNQQVSVTNHPPSPSGILSVDDVGPIVNTPVNFVLDTKNVVPKFNPVLFCGDGANVSMHASQLVSDRYLGACIYTIIGRYPAVATITYNTGVVNSNNIMINVRLPNSGNITGFLSSQINRIQVGQGVNVSLYINLSSTVAINLHATLICSVSDSVNMSISRSDGLSYTLSGICRYNSVATNTLYAIIYYTDSLGNNKTTTSNSISITSFTTTSGGGGGGGGGGNGGGNGGGGTYICSTVWQCTAWSLCINNSQNRTCTDVSHCTTSSVVRPDVTKQCANSQVPTTEQPVTIPEGTNTESTNNTYIENIPEIVKRESIFTQKYIYLYGAVFLFIVIVLISAIFIFKHKSSENEWERRLVAWISEKQNEGYNSFQLRDFLLRKGYNSKDVDEAIKKSGPRM